MQERIRIAFLLAFIFSLSPFLYGGTYEQAVSLMRQKQYDEALEILKELEKGSPSQDIDFANAYIFELKKENVQAFQYYARVFAVKLKTGEGQEIATKALKKIQVLRPEVYKVLEKANEIRIQSRRVSGNDKVLLLETAQNLEEFALESDPSVLADSYEKDLAEDLPIEPGEEIEGKIYISGYGRFIIVLNDETLFKGSVKSNTLTAIDVNFKYGDKLFLRVDHVQKSTPSERGAYLAIVNQKNKKSIVLSDDIKGVNFDQKRKAQFNRNSSISDFKRNGKELEPQFAARPLREQMRKFKDNSGDHIRGDYVSFPAQKSAGFTTKFILDPKAFKN